MQNINFAYALLLRNLVLHCNFFHQPPVEIALQHKLPLAKCWAGAERTARSVPKRVPCLGMIAKPKGAEPIVYFLFYGFSHLCDKFHVLKTVWLTSLCRRMEGPESSHQSGRVWVEPRDHPLTSTCPQDAGHFWSSPILQNFFCAENESLFCNECKGLYFSFMSL